MKRHVKWYLVPNVQMEPTVSIFRLEEGAGGGRTYLLRMEVAGSTETSITLYQDHTLSHLRRSRSIYDSQIRKFLRQCR